MSLLQQAAVPGRGRRGREQALAGLHGLVMPAHALARLLREHGSSLPSTPRRPESPASGTPPGLAAPGRAPQGWVPAARWGQHSGPPVRMGSAGAGASAEQLNARLRETLPQPRTRPRPATTAAAAATIG